MIIKEYRDFFIEKLTPLYDAMEAESLFAIALLELKSWKRKDLALNHDAVLSSGEITRWNEVLTALERHKPIQYIFRKAYFYGMDFTVDENTLIPRPETEELVEWIINENEGRNNLKVLDIGTGSGCIAIALAKKLPGAKVSAIDISRGALAIAEKNACKNKAEVYFTGQDVLNTNQLPGKFDIIVSNPPYVRHLEKREINKNVLEHEPHLALFVEDDDPLLFYRKIASLAIKSLDAGGKLYFEINQYLGNEMTDMLQTMQFKDIDLRQDIYGNDRMMRCTT